MNPFRAFRVHNENGNIQGRLESIDLDALNPGEVVIKAQYSDVNYKDALAATGAGKIMHRFPMVGGIDVSGYVHSSADGRFQPGAPVLVAGSGLSEDYDGGYAEYVRVRAESVVPLPDGLSLQEAMSLGTAGFTAGIAVELMERNGQHPDHGPILVTGATGGVGCIAVDIFSGLGYRVTSLTGKRDSQDFLEALGSSDIIFRDGLDLGKRPLEKALWGGAVDNLGGDILTWLTRTVKPFGNIASIGLAAGIGLHTTVMPFILRGVNLLGINSVLVPPTLRSKVWHRLSTDLKPRHLDKVISRSVNLDELPDVFEAYLKGGVTGRTLVKISA